MEAELLGPFGRMALGPGALTIGRGLDNRLVINNPTVSSHHAEIRAGVSGYSLTDLGSTNGTFVNEQQLAPHLPRLLQGSDRIRIGDMTFLYEAGRPDLQSPFVQENSHRDLPTMKVSAISQSEQFGDQPPAPYSSSTPQQELIPPTFTLAFEQSNTPLWATDRATGYGMPEQQSVPLTFPPTFGQPNTPTWATDRANGSGMPIQAMPFAPPLQSPPAQSKSSKWLKMLLIVLSIVLVLGAGGGGITAYVLTRPQPMMTVTSTYQVGSTPAGSTSTSLHVSAHSFSGSSAITFLLDNLPVASNQHVSSDANGTVKADLLITTAWPMGTHKLTAKDASGYATKVGAAVVIVPQGQAETPGPNGAPPDDMSFTLQVRVQPQDAGTGKQLDSYTETLTVMGKPDPAGGTVCQSSDDGQPHTDIGNAGNGITYRVTLVSTCSGTYKGGKLSYIGTATTFKMDYSNGISCVVHTPYVIEHLEGTFTSQNTISGTFSSDSAIADCSGGSGTRQINFNAQKGSWTAHL